MNVMTTDTDIIGTKVEEMEAVVEARKSVRGKGDLLMSPGIRMTQGIINQGKGGTIFFNEVKSVDFGHLCRTNL